MAALPHPAFRHGHAAKGRTSKEYWVWSAMLQRCTNPKNHAFSHYGGRGILVCRRWLKFANFIADMGPRPSGFTLERRNNNKGYSPRNCKWATWGEQGKNRRPRSLVTHCRKNHPMTNENTYVSPNGYRQCRECRREFDRHGRK